MAIVFREIGNLSSWEVEPTESWVAKDDVKSDALKHLKTTECALSVYLIEDRSFVDRVAAAFAAARPRIDAVTYALFDEELLNANGLEVARVAGTVPDPEVASWHVDIIRLSGSGLLRFAKIIAAAQEREKIAPTKVGRLINVSRAANQLEERAIQTKLLDELKDKKYSIK